MKNLKTFKYLKNIINDLLVSTANFLISIIYILRYINILRDIIILIY